MKISASSRSRSLLLLSAGYCFILLFLASLRPLWLDEVLQLAVAAHPINRNFIDQIRINAGATPLGYLVGFASERAFGLTWLSSRLPSILAGVASVASLFVLIAELDFPPPALACVLFAICPLQLRYATEGRPYELALLLSILSTICASRLNRDSSFKIAAFYTALLTIGIYFQPFAAFVAIGHGIWIAMDALKTRSWKALRLFALACAAAFALILPWYLFASPAWQPEQAHFTPGVVLALLREVSGDSYWCSIPLITAALFGFRKTPLAITVPALAALLGPLAADAAFGYFFAIRQFLFALPGLAIAASIGLVQINKRSRITAALLVIAFCIGAVSKTISYFGDRTENWSTAAAYIAARSDCVMFIPKGTVNLYSLFAPALSERACSKQTGAIPRAIVLAPHAADTFQQEFQRESAGLTVVSVGGSLIATPVSSNRKP